MQLAVESATRLLRARYGAIGILDESDQYKDFVFSGLPIDQTRLIATTPSAHGVTGTADHEQSVRGVPNSEQAARMRGIPAILVAQDALAVPVFSLGRAWGRLYVSSRVDGAPFSNLDELLAAHFAQYLSLALDRQHQIELFQEKETGYHQGEDRYRLLLDMAPGAVLVLQGGVVQMANAPAMQIAGATLLSDLVGRPIDDLLHPDYISRAEERIAQVTTSHARLPKTELRTRRLDGRSGWIEIEGARINYLGQPAILIVARDITKEKTDSTHIRALQRLTETVNRAASPSQVFDVALATLSATTHARCAAILMFNKKKALRFVAWNGIADTFFAAADGRAPWTPESIPATPVILADVQSEPSIAPIHTLLKAHGVESLAFIPVAHQNRVLGTFMLCYHERHAPKDDEIHMAQTVAEQVGVAVVRQWAVERLNRVNTELEDRVRRRTRQLEDANKGLEAFAYSVSHDLRAPLRALNGYSQILVEDYAPKLDATASQHLQRIIAASRRMEQLIDDLLRLSQVTRSHIELRRVDISDVAVETLNKLRETAPHRRTRVSITPNLCTYADPGLIRIMIENLFSNAWKYTSRKHDAHIEFGVTDNQHKSCYFVADNGAGFDMAHAGKLFSAFQRLHTPSEFEGTGIGLALVSRIIHRMGGTIWADAKPNEGATFYFTLWEDGLPDELRQSAPGQ